MNVLSLFTGIGGLELGFKRVFPDARVVLHVESDHYCQEVLGKRYPGIPILSDVYDLPGHIFTQEGIEIDWILAGFPCQAFSVAGKRRGVDDSRGLLFWEITRLSREISESQGRLPGLFLENVPGLLHMRDDSNLSVFGIMLSSLFELGYRDIRWASVGAGGQPEDSHLHAGAPHRRLRLWIVAYSGHGSGGDGEPRAHGIPDREQLHLPVGSSSDLTPSGSGKAQGIVADTENDDL